MTSAGLGDAATEVRATTYTISYAYNRRARVITATESPATVYDYSYDTVGNRQTVLLNGAKQGPVLNYDAADQVVGQSYDGAGNLLGDGTNTYSYNALNQLTGTAPNLAYAYNGDGALVSETAGQTPRATCWTQRAGSPSA